MGNAESCRDDGNIMVSSWSWRKGDDEIVRVMLPVYYTTDPLTSREIRLAEDSWNKIVENKSTKFHEEVKKGLEFENCQIWFQTIFYQRLFDVHPISKPMFRDPASQGNFLVALFSFVFTALEHEKKFRERLTSLAESHCKKGIKAIEYGLIGEVMFWTLAKVLGPEYTGDLHVAWVKIFSGMLKIIVPISIAHELKSNSAQIDRIARFEAEGEGSCPRVSNAEGCPVHKVMPMPTKESVHTESSMDTTARTTTVGSM